MWYRLILFAAAATSLWGQRPPICRPTPLDTYLGIDCNSREWQAIERNNEAHRDWRDQKERRVFQVRGEIGVETRRSPLDPLSLGLRYAEIEAICREIDDREKQLVVVNRNALTEAQKAKLAALEAAMQLIQTGNQAILRFLIEGTPVGISQGMLVGDFSALSPVRLRSGACQDAPTGAIIRVPMPIGPPQPL